MSALYRVLRDPDNPKAALGCIDLVESPDDDGWYAHQIDFTLDRSRMSEGIYPTKHTLRIALQTGKHTWGQWE